MPTGPSLVRAGLAILAALGAAVLLAAPALAHPLGNFTVNTYSALVAAPDGLRVDVVVDRAEIPTRQAFPDLDDRTGVLPGDVDATARQQCTEIGAGVALTVDGRAAPVELVGSSLAFPPGTAGLRTARLTCALRTTTLSAGLVGADVDYRLDGFRAGAGWHEVTAVGDGVSLAGSDVPERSVSDALRSYPPEQLETPLDVRSASFAVAPGSGVAAGLESLLGTGPGRAVARGADDWSRAFTDLVARDRLTAPFLALAAGAALVLGGLHAFAPGHGKTVMAAYLVGRRGSLRDAVVIGASVTATHTLGVLVLGVVLTAVGLASPERVYPWLGLASGLLLVGIGVALVRAAGRREPPALLTVAAQERVSVLAGSLAGPGTHEEHGHDHPHEHDHRHGDHPHSHDDPGGHEHPHAGTAHSHGLFSHTHAPPPRGSGVRGLLAIGFAGGLVPSPSALVVLLGGIALGRTWFGVTLVVLYGLGMALSLVAAGMVLVRARDRLDTLLRRSAAPRGLRIATTAARVLPVATALLVVLVGSGLTVRALAQL